jgi:3,4-dihydroxy 2-butanone 4-phosphate synthase/GTP cyclohydrolase II
MARRPDLELFAKSHGLKIGTIADLIRYRLKNERSVERIYDEPVDTEYGKFRLCCYEDHVNKTVHIALVKGDLEFEPAAAGARAHQGHACAMSSACAARTARLAAARGDAPRGTASPPAWS